MEQLWLRFERFAIPLHVPGFPALRDIALHPDKRTLAVGARISSLEHY